MRVCTFSSSIEKPQETILRGGITLSADSMNFKIDSVIGAHPPFSYDHEIFF